MSVFEIFADTGEIIERDFTPEELTQRELDIAAFEETERQRLAEEAERIAAKESAMQKLAALGLTEAEINAILGGIQNAS